MRTAHTCVGTRKGGGEFCVTEPRLFVEGYTPSIFGEYVPVVVQIELPGEWGNVVGDRTERENHY